MNNEAPTYYQPPPPQRIVRKANIYTTIFTDKNANYTLKKKFLNVVRSIPGTDKAKNVFTQEEVTSLVSKYILLRKDTIFDPRNIKLALVNKDPIGDAFGVMAFHRCQIHNLIRAQLIPVNNDCPTDVEIVTKTISPGVNVIITEKKELNTIVTL